MNAGVPQGSILCSLLFLLMMTLMIHINDLLTVLSSNASLLADDTSLFFSVARNRNTSGNESNNVLLKI